MLKIDFHWVFEFLECFGGHLNLIELVFEMLGWWIEHLSNYRSIILE